MRTIEKIYEAASRHKLMVSVNKAAIKFKHGASKEECERVERFLTKVAESAPFCKNTIRGHLGYHEESDTLYIVLQNGCKSVSLRFKEK